MPNLLPEVSIASDLAKQAGAIIIEVSQSDFSVSYKNPSDPVTEADKRANAIIVEGLQSHFPQDLIVAEESPPPTHLSSTGRVWYVDPLDGTKEFINKNGEYSVMIGLAINGRAKLGVVYQPSAGILYAGFTDDTAWMDTLTGRTPLHTANLQSPDLLTLVVSRSHRNPHIDAIKKQLGISREYSSGSVGLKIGLIARQQADIYIEPGPYTSLWDACAPEAIIRGAGGHFSDIYGNPILYGHDTLKNTKGLVATNGVCHDLIIKSLSSITEDIRS